MKNVIIYGLGKRYAFFKDWIEGQIGNSVEIIGVTDKKETKVEYKYPFIAREKLNAINFDEIIVTSDKLYSIAADKIISIDDILEKLYKKYFRIEWFVEKKVSKSGDHLRCFRIIYTRCVQVVME